ncbi:putative transcription factor C2H2 family [Helianthus debilis subsp. tardiflorus]
MDSGSSLDQERVRGNEGGGEPDNLIDISYLTCRICLSLLYEPTTTQCGHTYCRTCLSRAIDQSGKVCPICKTDLFAISEINYGMKSLLEKYFPEKYAERKLEDENFIVMNPDRLPLLILDVVLPCQKFSFKIFNDHEKLMVRRVLQGNRRMGMVLGNSTTGSIADYACEVEIIDWESYEDAFDLKVASRRRCRVLRTQDENGFIVAEIEWVQDLPPADESKEKELKDMSDRVAKYAQTWIKAAQKAARKDERRLAELHSAERLMPTTTDLERFSFWLATLTRRTPEERFDFLRIRDTKVRLSAAYKFMRSEE